MNGCVVRWMDDVWVSVWRWMGGWIDNAVDGWLTERIVGL